MEQGTLKEVLEVERQISEMLKTETERARIWLERREAEVEEARSKAAAELEASVARAKAAAKTSAEQEAIRILEQARSAADRALALNDAYLRPIVKSHIACILPESVRDH